MKKLALYTFKSIRYMTCHDLDELCSPLVRDVCAKVKCCSVTGREKEVKRCKKHTITVERERPRKRCKCSKKAVKK